MIISGENGVEILSKSNTANWFAEVYFILVSSRTNQATS